MAITTKDVLNKIVSYLAASGYVNTASIGEPVSPPSGWHASVAMLGYSLAQTTVDGGTTETRTATIRIFRAAVAEENAKTEIRMDDAVVKIQADLLGDFDLGAVIRGISLPLSVDMLYEQIPEGGAEYRVARLTIPLIVDDSATFAP